MRSSCHDRVCLKCSTYEAAAELARWDRAALERRPYPSAGVATRTRSTPA
jgi:hypothetical protein